MVMGLRVVMGMAEVREARRRDGRAAGVGEAVGRFKDLRCSLARIKKRAVVFYPM